MNYVLFAINALLAGNLVFSKYLGADGIMGERSDTRDTLHFGQLLTICTTVSTVVTWLLNYFLIRKTGFDHLQIIIFMMCVVTTARAMDFLKIDFDTEKYFMMLVSNSAIFGVAFIVAGFEMNFIQAVLYAVFGGIGYTGALLLMSGLSKHLQYNDIPKPFRGVPVILLTAALISMALSGFLGV